MNRLGGQARAGAPVAVVVGGGRLAVFQTGFGVLGAPFPASGHDGIRKVGVILLSPFVAGLFFESTILVLLLAPIFVPVITKAGVDPVHFGILMMTIVTLGSMTPPGYPSSARIAMPTRPGSPGTKGSRMPPHSC